MRIVSGGVGPIRRRADTGQRRPLSARHHAMQETELQLANAGQPICKAVKRASSLWESDLHSLQDPQGSAWGPK